MRYLTFDELLELHRLILERSGGLDGILNIGAIESAVSQPYMTFDGKDLYSGLVEKAATLGFALIANHPFFDGNKRVGHAAMETFLILNGYEIDASIDEQEYIIVKAASGEISRDEFSEWLESHIIKL